MKQKHAKDEPVRIFISSASEDAMLVWKIRKLLTARLHADVFTPEDLVVGMNWAEKLRQKLQSADILLAVLTPAGLASDFVQQELGAAWVLQKPILPLISQRALLKNVLIPIQDDLVIEAADFGDPANADKIEAVLKTIAKAPAA